MLNYANLNDVEFEDLCKDVMELKLGTTLRKYARGRDGGIDISDNAQRNNIVVQVKHYTKSSFSKLRSSLESEVGKVKALSPKQYYVCCSQELTPDNVNEIFNLFSGYMSDKSHVVTLNEINDIITNPANVETLKKHYKLWIESSGILQDVFNNDIFIDCESLLADIERQRKLFVKTTAFDAAVKCLELNRSLFITGHPGVGKTMTSKMLVLHFAALNYRVRYTTNTSDLKELKKSLTRDKKVKEIVLVDDCFGQAYFKMRECQNEEILSLINYVKASPNKLLILNSRITIWQEAKRLKPELLQCFESKRCQIYILNMDRISYVEKAKIFYNHISFNILSPSCFDEIKKEKRYLNIIKHANYTPRIIEFICNNNRYQNIPPSQYYNFVIQKLNNPSEIWRDEYENRLQKGDRLLLLSLYTLSDTEADEAIVKKCFEHMLSYELDVDTTIDQYKASLDRLLQGFVLLIPVLGKKQLKMVNPSINDFLDGFLNSNIREKYKLIDQACCIQQMRRLLNEDDFNEFVQSSLRKHEIEKYIFECKEEKNAFVSYYVCRYKIFDKEYTPYIRKFINKPVSWRHLSRVPLDPIVVCRFIFENDTCRFYEIDEYISDEKVMIHLISKMPIADMFELVCLMESLFEGEKRKIFIETISALLNDEMECYCSDIDISNLDVDIEYAIEKAENRAESFDDIVYKAVSYIDDEIISDVENELYRLISTLPSDICEHLNSVENLPISTWGVEEAVREHLKLQHSDEYDAWIAKRYEDGTENTEIDLIFSRESRESFSAPLYS